MSPPRTLTRWLAALCGLGIAACASGPGERVEADSDVRSGTLAILQMERWADLGDAPAHLVADAKVARYHGIDGQAVQQLLGGHSLEVERCGFANGLADVTLGLDTGVELLDVGHVQVQLGSLDMVLAPRVFPALAGAAGGVFYAADTTFAAPSAQQDEYRVRAPGSEGAGQFDVVLPAPAALEDVAIAGHTLALDTDALQIARGADLQVTWAALDPSDRVEIEIAAGRDVLTCVGRDDGHMTLSATTLGGLDADADALLTVRRVRLAPFDMQGIDVAYVRAVAAASRPLSLQ